MSSVQSLTGQELVNGALARLGGLSNAIDANDMLDYINEGKNELWAYLKGLRQDYFGKSSQSADSTQDNYFVNLTAGVREYELPKDCREVKFVEVTTSGYEALVFKHRDMASAEWKEARVASNSSASTVGEEGTIYYDIFGTQMVLASYPPATLAITLRYIAALPDIEMDEACSSFLFPYFGKLKVFGAVRATLGVRDIQGFSTWREEWKSSLLSAMAAASTRQIADAKYVEGFLEDDMWD